MPPDLVSFYPLSLFQALTIADDPEKLAQRLLMQGNFYLKDQIIRHTLFSMAIVLAGS